MESHLICRTTNSVERYIETKYVTDEEAYYLGRIGGDGLSTLIGAGMTLLGALGTFAGLTGDVGGIAATLTGAGAVVGVPVTVVSAVVTVGGVAVTIEGGATVIASVSNLEDNYKNYKEAAEEAKENHAERLTQGKSRAPETGEPGSIYEQIDNNGNVVSRTKYGENGRPEYRDDLLGRAHYDKKSGQYLKQHRHTFNYNDKGQPIGDSVIPIPD